MPTISELQVISDPTQLQDAEVLVVVGRQARLLASDVQALVPVDDAAWEAAVRSVDAGDSGGSTSTWADGRKVIAGVLPEPCSRHNSPSRAWAIPGLAKKVSDKKPGALLLAVDSADDAFPAALAAARGLPLYSRRTSATHTQPVSLLALAPSGPVDDPRLQPGVDSVREAARLVDMPCSELNTDAFVQVARDLATELGVSVAVMQGEALEEAGMGGLISVGQAADHPPALVVLEHAPEGWTRTQAWVGKGIVYDTGGLSIKTKNGMPGMKGDMGGAAAVIGGFAGAVRAGSGDRLLAVLCLAENAVGPKATRPDDIITMRSGKTVEVNNTDAEGRLVLADGLAWVIATHSPDRVIDLATLTGAALVATGKVHAGVYCNDLALEREAVDAGLRAGEPVHPFVYAPELFRKEFRSEVADMKNSVKDRANAQSSCAGQFIGNHLPSDPPPWLHVDIAGPAWDSDNRGTGYGVGLLMELALDQG